MANPIPTKTSFKPGQSGNPAGKQSRTPVRDCFYRLNAQSDGNMVREVCEKVVALAKEGEAWAVQAIFDRMDGKPAQAVTGADGGPLQFERIIRTIVDPRDTDA